MIYEQNMVRISTKLVKIPFHFWDFYAAPNFLALPGVVSFSIRSYKNKEVISKCITQKESMKVWKTGNQAVQKWRRKVCKKYWSINITPVDRTILPSAEHFLRIIQNKDLKIMEKRNSQRFVSGGLLRVKKTRTTFLFMLIPFTFNIIAAVWN